MFVPAGQTRGDAGPGGLLPHPVRVRRRLLVHRPHRHPSHPPAGPPRRHREEVPPVQVSAEAPPPSDSASPLGELGVLVASGPSSQRGGRVTFALWDAVSRGVATVSLSADGNADLWLLRRRRCQAD